MEPWAVESLLGIAGIATVVTLMLYPVAGAERYFRYRPPLFVTAVAFMPLFLYFAAALATRRGRPDELQLGLILLGMLGFWASAAIAAHAAVHGEYVPGLRFRPDFILPGGVLLVKGTILLGMGIAIASHAHLQTPKWNWWGFIYAFWGILTVIPVRGMYKMLCRRSRLLGRPGSHGFRATLVKEALLFIGLGLLLFGFVHAFTGRVPFTRSPHSLDGAWQVLLAAIVLVGLRGWYKTTLREGVETTGELLVKQGLYLLGTVPLAHGTVRLFTPNAWAVKNIETNPLGVAAGAGLAALGVGLLALRVAAVRHELAALLRVMPGLLCELPEDLRQELMRRRLGVLAAYPEAQRLAHLREMLAGRDRLPPNRRALATRSMVEALAKLPRDAILRVMAAMDQLSRPPAAAGAAPGGGKD